MCKYFMEHSYHLFFLAVIIAHIFAWVISTILSRHRVAYFEESSDNTPVFKDALWRLNAWLMTSFFWQCLEILFVILPFAASVIVVYLTAEGPELSNDIMLYSIISLSLIVFGYAINPQVHKICYRRGYLRLDIALTEYLAQDEGSRNEKILVTAIRAGEQEINPAYGMDVHVKRMMDSLPKEENNETKT